jgi:hypothetical protein
LCVFISFIISNFKKYIKISNQMKSRKKRFFSLTVYMEKMGEMQKL